MAERSAGTRLKAGPLRTCAGCGRRRPQAELLRVAKDQDATVVVEPVGLGARRSSRRRAVRASGRGAYLCPEEVCLKRALQRGALGRALRYTGPLPDGLERELRERIAVKDAAAARVEPGR